MIRCSVVIPVLDDREGLTRCLEALVVQQTLFPFEVVVVDDGSTVDLEPVRSQFQNVLTLAWERLARNAGPATARNRGIERARGEIVLFTDADCRPDPDWVQRLCEPFSDPAVTGAKGVYRTEQSDLWARLAQLEFAERYDCLARAGDIDFVDTYCGAFRRADLLAVGGFDTSFRRADNEDVDLSFRVKARGGRFVFVPGAVVSHRHREGARAYFRLKVGRGYWRMKVYDRHPGKAGRDSYTPLSLKVQLLLVALLPLLLFCRRLREWWALAWVLSGIPLASHALRQGSWREALAVPAFTLVRGIALVAGMAKALIERAAGRFRPES